MKTKDASFPPPDPQANPLPSQRALPSCWPGFLVVSDGRGEAPGSILSCADTSTMQVGFRGDHTRETWPSRAFSSIS